MGRTKPWTKAQRARAALMKEHGCIIFRKLGLGWRLPDIHHILDGGRQISHNHTIPLDPWFHEGHPPEGMTKHQALATFGPSLKLHKRAFIRKFGTELDLLDEINERIGLGQGDERL
jgi:hypothetical protein